MKLTQERLKELLKYDPETGLFTWRSDRGANRLKGKVAGSPDTDGYTIIGIDDRPRKAHRLVFLYVFGSCPPIVDHIDGIRVNNRLTNLRGCSRRENTYNRHLCKRNKTGFVGVQYRPSQSTVNPYCAAISYTCNGLKKTMYLGTFATAVEASDAYKCMKAKLHTIKTQLKE